MPSAALTAPSFIEPPRESVGSSSCSASTPPHRRWYCSALRSIPALRTGVPSSVKPSAPSAPQLGHLGQLLALQAARDRGEEADGHARLARGGVAQRAQQRRGVEHGVGVGHRDHRGEAAGGRGARAAREILLVLLPGRAQVHVRVEEGGHGDRRPPPSISSVAGVGLECSRRRRARRSRRPHEHVGRRRDPRAGRARARRAAAARRAARARSERRLVLMRGLHRRRARLAAGVARPPGARRGARRAARRARPCARPRRPRPAR